LKKWNRAIRPILESVFERNYVFKFTAPNKNLNTSRNLAFFDLHWIAEARMAD